MFIKINNNGIGCKIVGFGHTELSDNTEKFREVSQTHFITEYLSDAGRAELFGHVAPFSEDEIKEKVEKCINQTGIANRIFFAGETSELAIIAAQKCLKNAGVNASDVDAIIVGTNTGTGYPSVADHVKNGLGVKSDAMCCDVTEACTAGTVAVFNGWSLIHSGLNNVLVVLAEKATQLARLDDWKASNLFSDAAGALLLQKSAEESFIFFDIMSNPYDGGLEAIFKNKDGYFSQDGPKVHKFVGRDVVASLSKSLERAGLSPCQVDHLVPHQPSGKTLKLLKENIEKSWTGFTGSYHQDMTSGNTSSASTPSLLSKLVERKVIKKGETIFVTTFGAGISIGNYAFRYI